MSVKIIHSDCMDYLPRMADESVDCVVTDCPYRIISGGIRIVEMDDECSGVLNRRDYSTTDPKGVLSRGRRVVTDGSQIAQKWLKKGGNIPSAVKDGKMFKDNDIKFSEWLPEVYRVLKRGTHCYVMINSRNLKDLQVAAESAGFAFQNLLVWDKGNCTPNKYYMQATEYILLLSKRPARNINNMGTTNILRFPNVRDKRHPTEKPPALFKCLINNSTLVGDLVLDPFLGVGAAAVASKGLSRKFVGIEINKEYYDIAIQSMSTPEQTNLLT